MRAHQVWCGVNLIKTAWTGVVRSKRSHETDGFNQIGVVYNIFGYSYVI